MTQYQISFPSGADLSMGGLREGQRGMPLPFSPLRFDD
jgi:hypothetical protein